MLVNLAVYDYLEAIDRGDSPDPSAWAARNPEIADELNAYFEDLKALKLLPLTTTDVRPSTGNQAGGADLQPGEVLGDYVLLEKLGEGGQGVVWTASPKLNREIVVALKTLRGPASSDPASIHGLRQDVRDCHDETSEYHPHIFLRRGPRALVFRHGTHGRGDRRRSSRCRTAPNRGRPPGSWKKSPGRFITPTRAAPA